MIPSSDVLSFFFVQSFVKVYRYYILFYYLLQNPHKNHGKV